MISLSSGVDILCLEMFLTQYRTLLSFPAVSPVDKLLPFPPQFRLLFLLWKWEYRNLLLARCIVTVAADCYTCVSNLFPFDLAFSLPELPPFHYNHWVITSQLVHLVQLLSMRGTLGMTLDAIDVSCNTSAMASAVQCCVTSNKFRESDVMWRHAMWRHMYNYNNIQ